MLFLWILRDLLQRYPNISPMLFLWILKDEAHMCVEKKWLKSNGWNSLICYWGDATPLSLRQMSEILLAKKRERY